MRPAGALAKAVKAHPECEVTLSANNKTVKAGAPMQIMSACIKKGCNVEIICNGTDEETVMDEIVKMFDDGFGE